MPRARLDPALMQKLSGKLRIHKNALNVRVSQKANKLGISSEAALVILAKEHGIGTAVVQRRLDPAIQSEIRASLPAIMSHSRHTASNASKVPKPTRNSGASSRTVLRAAVEYMLQDDELRSRCEDLLLGKLHFDRAVNQATQVLEERLRKTAKPSAKLVGEKLVGFALNADFSRTVLKVSENEEEQRGITDIVRGIVPAFRNTTHHHLVDNFTREDAIRVCGFIDVLLRVVDRATKIR